MESKVKVVFAEAPAPGDVAAQGGEVRPDKFALKAELAHRMEGMKMNDKTKRIQNFNSKKSPLSIIVGLPMPAEAKASLELKAAKLPPNEFPGAEQLLPLWDEWLAFQQLNELDDDRVLSLYPRQYDQGIYGAMFGAEMECLLEPGSGWGWASSNSLAFEDKPYEELLALGFNPENAWLRRMRGDLRCFAEKFRGRLAVSTIITVDGFNFAHQIRGSGFFEDIHDRPGELKALLALAADINIKFVEFQRDATGESCGSGAYCLGGLFPARTVAMSVDTYNMCSPATYEEFGRPYQQRLIDHFGGGAFHLHGNGRHLLPELAKLSGFVSVSVSDDGARTRAFDDRKKLRELGGELLLNINCGKDELAKAIREKSLVPARYCASCDNADEANRLLDQFRNYTM